MGNSLYEVSNEVATKLNELRQSIKHPNNKEKIFVLIEGSSDIKFFRKIFTAEYVDTRSLNGKEKIKTVLKELAYFKNLIGIKDADFDHLENELPMKNLFLTDLHDIETEMLETDAFNSLIAEFGDDCYEKFTSELRSKLYEIGLSIGYLRWHNEKEYKKSEEYVLLFDGLDFKKFISKNECFVDCDYTCFFESLLTHSKSKNVNLLLTVDSLKIIINDLKKLSKDKQQICCGHDLTEILAIAFGKNMNRSKVEGALRLAYRINDFKTTQLCTSLENWCSANQFEKQIIKD